MVATMMVVVVKWRVVEIGVVDGGELVVVDRYDGARWKLVVGINASNINGGTAMDLVIWVILIYDNGMVGLLCNARTMVVSSGGGGERWRIMDSSSGSGISSI